MRQSGPTYRAPSAPRHEFAQTNNPPPPPPATKSPIWVTMPKAHSHPAAPQAARRAASSTSSRPLTMADRPQSPVTTTSASSLRTDYTSTAPNTIRTSPSPRRRRLRQPRRTTQIPARCTSCRTRIRWCSPCRRGRSASGKLEGAATMLRTSSGLLP